MLSLRSYLIVIVCTSLVTAIQTQFDIDLGYLHPTQGFSIYSGSQSDSFGYKTSFIGDINADGIIDLLVTAPTAGSSPTRTSNGIVYILYGPKNGFLNINITTLTSSQGFRIIGASTLDQLGLSVAAEDIDDDGIKDLIITAPYASPTMSTSQVGVVYVIYGRTIGFSDIDLTQFNAAMGFRIWGAEQMEHIQSSISGAGDINGDGINDLIIGKPYENNLNGLPANGTVYVLYGSKKRYQDMHFSDWNKSIGFRVTSSSSGVYFGFSVSSAGDVNADGYDDFLIGAPSYTASAGSAYIIFGRKNSFEEDIDLQVLASSQGIRITTNTTLDLFGYSVSSAGDMNNDGVNDVLVGSPTSNPLSRTSAGSVHVVFGMKEMSSNIDVSSLNTKQGFQILGSAAGDLVGAATKNGGDMTGDGIDDIIIGAYNAGNTKGTVYVIYGRNDEVRDIDLSTLNYTQGIAILGAYDGSQLGVSIDGSTDVNGDGINDMLIGAPSTASVSMTGVAYIIFGQKPNCSQGTFPYGADCLDCPGTCIACSRRSQCQLCQADYSLYNAQCVAECPPGKYSQDGTCVDNTWQGPVATANRLTTAATMLSSAVSIGSSFSVTAAIFAKIMAYIKYLQIGYSSELKSTLKTWKTGLVSINMIPSLPDSVHDQIHSSGIAIVFSQWDLAPDFLTNFWQSLIILAGSFAVYCILKGLELYLQDNDIRTQTLLSRTTTQLRLAVVGFSITQIYGSLGDITLFVVLEASSVIFDSFLPKLSFSLAMIFTFIALLALFTHRWILQTYQGLLKNQNTQAADPQILENFLRKFRSLSPLYEDYKDTSIFSQSCLLILFVRGVFMSIIVGLLYTCPIAQSVLFVLMSACVMVYLSTQRIYEKLPNQLQQIFSEGILLVTNVSVLIMAILDRTGIEAKDTRERLGKGIILMNLMYNIVATIVMLVQVIVVIIDAIKARKDRGRNQVMRIRVRGDEARRAEKQIEMKEAPSLMIMNESSVIQKLGSDSSLFVNRGDKASERSNKNRKILPNILDVQNKHVYNPTTDANEFNL